MWKVVQVMPDEWVRRFSEVVHAAVFEKMKPASRDRLSYGLLCIKDDLLIGYVTVRELDDEAVYWQFGGSLPNYRRSPDSVRLIEHLLEWQRAHSKRVYFYVANTNRPMLRLALAHDFVIVGTRTQLGETYVDFVREFK